MNLTSYRKRASYGLKRRAQWSRNAVAAKARKRIERGAYGIPNEPATKRDKLPTLKTATVSIRCGAESISFRVMRYDAKRLLMRGKAQAATTIGRRVALVLEAVL